MNEAIVGAGTNNMKPKLLLAAVYGFNNIQNLVRKHNTGSPLGYDYVEVMACPTGCLNGGGQLLAETGGGASLAERRAALAAVESVYESMLSGWPEEDDEVVRLHRELLLSGDMPAPLLSRTFTAISTSGKKGFSIKW
jgi:hypothetical protein